MGINVCVETDAYRFISSGILMTFDNETVCMTEEKMMWMELAMDSACLLT